MSKYYVERKVQSSLWESYYELIFFQALLFRMCTFHSRYLVIIYARISIPQVH